MFTIVVAKISGLLLLVRVICISCEFRNEATKPIDRLTLRQGISTWSILDMVENKHQKRQPCPSSCLRSVAPRRIVGLDLVDDARKVPILIPARLFLNVPPDIQLNLTLLIRLVTPEYANRAKGRTSGYAGPSWGALSS